jgi:hypothetical protein
MGVMHDAVEFDPALAGLWPVGRSAGYSGAHDGVSGWRLEDEVRAVLLETKSEQAALSPVEDMQALLNEMTAELRAQFSLFRTIRERAGPGLDGEDAEAKVAKADAKAAVDSMGLIARTLEKIDDMQRRLADALARQAEEVFDDAAYKALVADIDRKISARAEERANALLAARAAAAADGTGPPGGEGGPDLVAP